MGGLGGGGRRVGRIRTRIRRTWRRSGLGRRCGMRCGGWGVGVMEECVLGMGGWSKVSDRAVAREFHGALEAVGLKCPVTMVPDAEVAFASATGEPDGTVLVAGTGSVAARIVNRRKE